MATKSAGELYEELRRKKLEENQRKLEELNLHHLSFSLREAAAAGTTPKPSPVGPATLLSFLEFWFWFWFFLFFFFFFWGFPSSIFNLFVFHLICAGEEEAKASSRGSVFHRKATLQSDRQSPWTALQRGDFSTFLDEKWRKICFLPLENYIVGRKTSFMWFWYFSHSRECLWLCVYVCLHV